MIGYLFLAWSNSSFAQSPGDISSTSEQVSIQEGMSTKGLFDTNTAIALLVLAIVAASWWLFRQRELMGNYTTVFVACLRLIVIATANWMLMEPNSTRTETVSRASEILLLADASGSMETIDSPDSATAQLWSHAIDQQPNDHRVLQSAMFHLKIAMRNLDRSAQPSIDSLRQSTQRLKSLTAKQSSAANPAKLAKEMATRSAEEASATKDAAEKRALIASHTEAMETALVELDSLTRLTFTVQALRGLESLLTEANPLLLKEISETTGGFSIDPALVREIPNAISLKPEVSERREAQPLWNRWSSLGLIVGCLSMEWFVRRRRGLV